MMVDMVQEQQVQDKLVNTNTLEVTKETKRSRHSFMFDNIDTLSR
jgi:hypothetical protein